MTNLAPTYHETGKTKSRDWQRGEKAVLRAEGCWEEEEE